MSLHDQILFATAACYLLATGLLYLAVENGSARTRTFAVALTLIGVLLHSWAESQHWLIPPAPEVSLTNALSLCALVTVAIPLITVPFKNSLFDANLVALPLAVLILLAEGLLNAPLLQMSHASPAMTVHIVTSVVAFGVLSIASVYALFIAIIDHLLRRHSVNRLVQALPALDTLEALLFHLIRTGFAILTVSLATGLLFVENLFAQHLVHKTLLSIFAWLVFAVLLWGRWKRGWRGRLAVRLTLAGIALLLLAYFGSKLILEVLLKRTWVN